MNNSNLEFRKIPSLQYLYEVNENGTVFRNVKSKKQLRIKLDMHHSKVGYYATFVNIKGKVKRVMIHRVVAECWHGPRPDGFEVDHIDRNTHNNDYRNLRYVTHSQQMKNRILSEAVIRKATLNCIHHSMTEIAIPIEVKNIRTGAFKKFPSMMSCSRYLADLYGKTAEHMRRKLKKRRKVIYDFEIFYGMHRLDVLALRSKEQSTNVSSGKYEQME